MWFFEKSGILTFPYIIMVELFKINQLIKLKLQFTELQKDVLIHFKQEKGMIVFSKECKVNMKTCKLQWQNYSKLQSRTEVMK